MNIYPLAKPLVTAGVLAGLLTAGIFGSLVTGFAFLVVFVATGLVWRANEPPVLSFALGFQWVFIVIGYLYTQAGGELKEDKLGGNVEGAIFLSLVGLLCLTLGLRLGIAGIQRVVRQHIPDTRESQNSLDLAVLFWTTVVTYSVSWVIEISPMKLFFDAAQIIYSVLSFREVLLCLLWLMILQRRDGYRYGVAAFVIALVPRFTSRQSTFKELIFMLLIVSLMEFKPWLKTKMQRQWNRRLAAVLVGVVLLLILAGIVWEGAIKPVWRRFEFEGTPTETLSVFAQVAMSTTRDLEVREGLRALISRLSSITQFALVIDRVPGLLPHEDGKLTMRAIKHILLPRVFFPEKENLGRDSWLAVQYAGITVGEDTSVGIGYMAEFYVDWGIVGMFVCLVALGIVIGAAYALMFVLAPSSSIARALVIVPFIGNFITFEATLPKLLGGFIMNTVMLLILVRAIPHLTRTKSVRKLTVVPARG